MGCIFIKVLYTCNFVPSAWENNNQFKIYYIRRYMICFATYKETYFGKHGGHFYIFPMLITRCGDS